MKYYKKEKLFILVFGKKQDDGIKSLQKWLIFSPVPVVPYGGG